MSSASEGLCASVSSGHYMLRRVCGLFVPGRFVPGNTAL